MRKNCDGKETMRLIFLYVTDGAAGSQALWNPKKQTRNRFAHGLPTEGYFWMLHRMLETKIVDEILVIVESNRGPGQLDYGNNIKCLVVPNINLVESMLKKDDVIFCRGGFRGWFHFLNKMSELGHWALLYAANTGRARWLFWDVVFDDISGRNFVDVRNRVHLDFRKPTHPKLFYPRNIERKYDLCIGASHIHDKKGQWRVINALIEYQKMFGVRLKCVMPGAIRRGVKTSNIYRKIKENSLNVVVPSMVPRKEVGALLSQSKVFVHVGSSGQGDRGPLEAIRCGCPLIIGFPQYHAPFVYEDSVVTYVSKDASNPKVLAQEIHDWLPQSNEDKRKIVFDYSEVQSGVERVTLPKMKRLFDFIREHPVADRKLLGEVVNSYGKTS